MADEILHERPTMGAVTIARGGAVDLGDLFDSGRDVARYVDNSHARITALEEAYDRRIDRVREATGVTLDNPLRPGPTSRRVDPNSLPATPGSPHYPALWNNGLGFPVRLAFAALRGNPEYHTPSPAIL